MSVDCDVDEHITKLTQVVSSLKKQNTELKERVKVLEEESSSLRGEIGAGMFKNREPIADLVAKVQVLQESLATKKKKPHSKGTSGGKSAPSLSLAEGMVDGSGELSLIPPASIVIEDV